MPTRLAYYAYFAYYAYYALQHATLPYPHAVLRVSHASLCTFYLFCRYKALVNVVIPCIPYIL